MSEKLVTIIERHVGANAEVHRDVRLPILGSRIRRKAQCDVVIIEGEGARKTISIVEVQKRGRKPEINDFRGWLKKMRDVGAQHLICVSEAGFPDSIEEEADDAGPTVRLVTFQQLEDGDWPINPFHLSDELDVVEYIRLPGMQMEGEHLMATDPNRDPSELPDPHEKMFRVQGDKLVSATDLMDWHLFGSPENIAALPKNKQITLGVKFAREDSQGIEYQDFHGNWVRLRWLLIHLELEIQSREVSWDAAKYEQRGWGELAWVLRATADIDGAQMEIVTPLSTIGPGEFKVGHPILLGEFDAFVAIDGAGYEAKPYQD